MGIIPDVLAREVLESQDARLESEVDPETLIVDSLGSGVAADVYRLSCFAECIRADVRDTGPFNDTIYKVVVSGSSSNFVGTASAISPRGGTSILAEVCSGSNVNAARAAFVVITEVNNAGAENYDSSMTCRQSGGADH